MPERARRLAERCFALARSTTFTGEREAAIARGTAIASKAGLSLDLFDIPGRARPAPRRRKCAEPSVEERARRDDLREVIRVFREHMAADWKAEWWTDELAACAADAGSGVAAAFERGRLDAAMRLQRLREAQLARWPDLQGCANFLSSRGEPVYSLGDDDEDGFTWICPGRDRRLSDTQLRDLADEIAGTSMPAPGCGASDERGRADARPAPDRSTTTNGETIYA